MGILVIPTTGNYTNKDAAENVIHYITRTRIRETRRNELLDFGGMGIAVYSHPDKMIEQMFAVQNVHGMNKRCGPRVHHEFFLFSEAEQAVLDGKEEYLKRIALQCCEFYYSNGYQVIYALHRDKKGKIHIHFCVNAINFITGLKWHENLNGVVARNALFNDIVQSYMNIISPIEFE